MARPRMQGLRPRSERAPSGARAKRRRQWVSEGLEDRVLLSGLPAPTVYTVNLTTDAGTSNGANSGDLLFVITQANADPNPGGTEIEFDPTVFNATSPQTITLSSTLELQGTAGPEVIDGPGTSVLSINGNNATQVFSVSAGVTASIAGLTVTGGASIGNGGGIDNAGALSLTNLDVTGNTSALSGGGVANESTGTLTVDSSTLSNNTATGSGGGIDNAGTLVVTSSTIASNTAATGGGIAQESTGTFTITNSTIANNMAVNGGGVSSVSPGTFIDTTIAYNNASASTSGGGGLSLATGGNAALYNTIVAVNTAGVGQSAVASDIDVSLGGSLAPSSANNLIGTGGSGGLAGGGSTANLVGVTHPGLDTGLKSNGGLTQTIALVAGSPAIDTGSTSVAGVPGPEVDQRGALRGSEPEALDAGTAVDIGAYEASSSYLVSTTSDAADTGTLATAVSWANVSTNALDANLPKPFPNTIVFDQAGAFATPQTITVTGTLALDNTTNDIDIVGPATGSLTISGGNAVGVFSVASGVNASITGLTISGGFASSGGAIDNSGSTNVINDTFTGNSAASGAAIANTASGTLSVLDSTFTLDTATASGGAIANAGTATLTNTTIADESAPLGAGIYNTGNLTLINDTIADNNATQVGGGGGLDSASGVTATLFNSIFARNTAGSGANAAFDDISNSVSTNSSNNVIDDANSAGNLVNSTNGNIIGVDAGIATSLASNGGSTQTFALLPTSPALHAGAAAITGQSVPTTDQRGAVRNPVIVNNVATIDAGAYEVGTSYVVTSAADSLVAGTLRSAIAFANGNPGPSSSTVPSTIVFDPTFFSTPQTINLSDSLGTLAFNTGVPVTIEGPGAGLVTIEGDGTFGLFSIPAGEVVNLSGLTLSGGGVLTQSATQSNGDALPQTGGGAILNQGLLTISDSVLSNNSAVYYGGAIYNQGGTLNVSFTTFANNTATYGLGGAIDNSGTLNVANSTFTGGVAFEGGAIDNKAGSLTVTTSTFDSNTAIQGGAIFNNATARISGTTLSNNVAFQGGAIANDLTSTLMLTNSTIAGNSAGQNGGGINQVGILTVVSSTIAYNTVAGAGAGGGIDASAGTTTLYNTIVAGNTTTTTTTTTGTTGTGTTPAIASDLAGTIASASSNNLIGGIVADKLGPLADNGGPNETVALLAGSPAIDAGASSFTVASGSLIAPALDQRGALRGPAGLNAGTAIDIGSYEATSSYQVSSLADPSLPGTPAIGTLRMAVSWADNNQNFNKANITTPVQNSIAFTTIGPASITLTDGPLVLSNTTVPVLITGPGANVMTISGGGASQVFQVASGVNASITGLTITDGSAPLPIEGQGGLGGAVDNAGTLLLSGVVISNSTAVNGSGLGGGLANEVGATATVMNSTLSNNAASTGGGIYNAGTLSLVDSTVAQNSASSEGAGIANFGTFTAISSTIAQNFLAAGGSGGGIQTVAGPTTLYDTIVAQNTVATSPGTINDIAGTVSPLSAFNLVGSAGSGGLTSANSNLIVSDGSAGLGTLGSNGGLTPTIPVLTGSPAAGRGSSTITGVTIPTVDQRGTARPTGAIDIGAYQSLGFVSVPIIDIAAPIKLFGAFDTVRVVANATPPVVTSAIVAPVPSTAGKVKVVASKKSHPAIGSAAKFHKPAKVVKAGHHITLAKAHPAAHAKKK